MRQTDYGVPIARVFHNPGEGLHILHPDKEDQMMCGKVKDPRWGFHGDFILFNFEGCYECTVALWNYHDSQQEELCKNQISKTNNNTLKQKKETQCDQNQKNLEEMDQQELW